MQIQRLLQKIKFKYSSTSNNSKKKAYRRFETLELRAMFHGLSGDFDSDGDVDGADFVAWQTSFPIATNGTHAQGDNDHDGDVDGADFAGWQSQFPAVNPHTDPDAAAQHAALISLVPYSQVTHRAIRSGPWDDAATWDHGVPTADANVLIPASMSVVLDSVQTEKIRTVRVDGELKFATDVNTQLTVDTLIVTPTGYLEIGTEQDPIAADVVARILIADRGEIDTAWDPTQLSRGLISHGQVSMYGTEVKSFVPISSSLAAGTTTLVLSGAPVGWKVGDRLVLTGSQYGKHDELQILAIQGQTITVSPLQYDHVLPEANLALYLANVTRNISIESETAADIRRRGHAMFMHTPDVDINNVGFYGLGRTNKRYTLNSAQLDAAGNIIPGTGTNQIGRYSVHFHSTGLDEGAQAAQIHGSAVVDSPGWGIVNHHSNVIAEDNVAFDIYGGAFVTEAGDEIGAFRRNLAIHSVGSGGTPDSRSMNPEAEFAHEGVGFWLQGNGVEVEGNIASGQRVGFFLYGHGLTENGKTTLFHAHNLPDRSLAAGRTAVPPSSFPLQFRDNLAFASSTGLATRYQSEVRYVPFRSQVDRFTSWGVNVGISTHYTFFIDFNELLLIGNGVDNGSGLAGDGVTESFKVNRSQIRGFEYGVRLPFKGDSGVTDTNLSNQVDISFNTNTELGQISIDNVRFIPSATLPAPHSNVYVKPLPGYSVRDLPNTFRNISPAFLDGMELYRPTQSSDYIPFPAATSPSSVPAALVGKTNQQLFDQFGLAIGGAIAPAGATMLPSSNVLIGPRFEGRSTIQQTSPTAVNSLEYTLSYRLTRGSPTIAESTFTQLTAGWNVLTRQIEGRLHSFFVYADVTAPVFTLRPNSNLAIHPGDLAKGLRIYGTISDDFFFDSFEATFRLDALPLQTNPDGSQFVTLNFQIRDVVGNTTPVSLNIRVDSSVPRIVDENPPIVIDPTRDLSFTLLGLLITLQD